MVSICSCGNTDLPTFPFLPEHLQPEIFLRHFRLNLYAIRNEELFFSKFLVDNAPEEIGKLASLLLVQDHLIITSVFVLMLSKLFSNLVVVILRISILVCF